MSADARFEDAAERPLRLVARDSEDLAVVSALLQDAVLTAADISWQRRRRRLVLLLNRFRWEDRAAGQGPRRRPPERVRALLVIGDVRRVTALDIPPGDGNTVLSLLALGFEPAEDGAGRLVATFSGDGALAAEVDCLDIALSDVSRPYAAPSRKVPGHPA